MKALKLKTFKIIPMGSKSTCENNLSAYALAPIDSHNYICLDAGTIINGIEKSINQYSFDDIITPHESNNISFSDSNNSDSNNSDSDDYSHPSTPIKSTILTPMSAQIRKKIINFFSVPEIEKKNEPEPDNFTDIFFGSTGNKNDNIFDEDDKNNQMLHENILNKSHEELKNIEHNVLNKSKSVITLKEFKRTHTNMSPEKYILLNHIKGYLISHAHLDHIFGLVLNSQIDDKKYIYCSNETCNDLKEHIFNWRIWPNFCNEGVEKCLNKYEYVKLNQNEKYRKIIGTKMKVKIFPLSHGNIISTAFIIKYKTQHIIYCGDAGSDNIEKSIYFFNLWSKIKKYVINETIAGIFIECSYLNDISSNELYGHLNPIELENELSILNSLVYNETRKNLSGLNIVIIHTKDSTLESEHTLNEELLDISAKLKCTFIIPIQGIRFYL